MLILLEKAFDLNLCAVKTKISRSLREIDGKAKENKKYKLFDQKFTPRALESA